MGSPPWKDAYVFRVQEAFDGEPVTVKTPGIIYSANRDDGGLTPTGLHELTGRFMGDGNAGALRCLIVNVAGEEAWRAWHAAPDVAARKALDIFQHDRWVALVRGVDVNGLVAGA